NGQAVLCCDDAEGKTNYGNIFEIGIEAAWNNMQKEHAVIYDKKYSEAISPKKECPLVITGGGADLILPILDMKYIYNENLSFMGLKYIYERENDR
ncbi:MAG: hypothetical protein CL697_04750, partial [Chloroflexi bacterium]|nr:hypothetical protein [Chloroflexota bacterium]